MADHLLVGKPVMVPVDDLQPNPWNYNVQKDSTFAKLAASIRRHGFARPLIVRTLPGGSREIIDGEHGWRAAKLLGLPEVPCVDLGTVPDSRAKEMTVVLNELGGTADEARLSELVRGLMAGDDATEVMTVLPYSTAQLELLASTVDFSFTSASKGDSREEPDPKEPKPPKSRDQKLRVDLTGDEALEAVQLLGGSATPELFVMDALRAMMSEDDDG